MMRRVLAGVTIAAGLCLAPLAVAEGSDRAAEPAAAAAASAEAPEPTSTPKPATTSTSESPAPNGGGTAAPPPGANASCEAREKGIRKAGVDAWARFQNVRADLWSSQHCDDLDVVCLGYDGELATDGKSPPTRDVWPASVKTGDVLTIVSLTPGFDEGTVDIFAKEEQYRNTLFAPPGQSGQPEKPEKPAPLAAPPPCDALTDQQVEELHRVPEIRQLEGLLSRTRKKPPPRPDTTPKSWDDWIKAVNDLLAEPAPGTAKALPAATLTAGAGAFLLIQIQRTLPNGTVERRISKRFLIDTGRYYLDVGVLVPMVSKGTRTFYERRDLGTGERRLALEEDTKVSAAIVLEVFPFGGRARDRLWFTEGPRPLASLVGFQFGTSIAHPTDEYYLGGVLEPISGLSVDFGCAWMRQSFLPSGTSTSLYIPAGETITPRQLLQPHPYIGLTMSLGIVNALASARSQVPGF